MVSPSDAWDDTDDGFQKGDTGLFVTPCYVANTDNVQMAQTVPRGEENAYAVELVRGLGHAPQQHDVLVRFADEVSAWEFAHLFTHYIDEKMGADMAMMDIDDPYGDSGAESLPEIIEDRSAEQALRMLLGRYSGVVDRLPTD
jgi:hypothetical protein